MLIFVYSDVYKCYNFFEDLIELEQWLPKKLNSLEEKKKDLSRHLTKYVGTSSLNLSPDVLHQLHRIKHILQSQEVREIIFHVHFTLTERYHGH